MVRRAMIVLAGMVLAAAGLVGLTLRVAATSSPPSVPLGPAVVLTPTGSGTGPTQAPSSSSGLQTVEPPPVTSVDDDDDHDDSSGETKDAPEHSGSDES